MRRVLVLLAWLAAVGGAGAMVWIAASPSSALGDLLVPVVAMANAAVVYASVGAILSIRRPANVIGALLQVGGLLIAVTFVGFIVGAAATEAHGPDDPIAVWASFAGSVTVFAMILVVGPAIALLFPDGRLPGLRWRLPAAVIVVALVGGNLLAVLQPGPLNSGLANSPFGIEGAAWVGPVSTAGAVAAALSMPAMLLLAVAAVVVRFRRSTGIERKQLTWFVAANVAFAVLLLLAIADGSEGFTPFDVLALVSLALPAVAIGMAILRYRLYEIDRIISRTIGWATVTGILVAVFAGLVVTLQTLLAPVTDESTLAVAASTLVAFTLFQPLRRRVQHAVDRRFDRARYDGERTAAAFGERLRGEIDLKGLETDMTLTVVMALRPRTASLWIRLGRT